jgi:ketosteroid isomerase-like protein
MRAVDCARPDRRGYKKNRFDRRAHRHRPLTKGPSDMTHPNEQLLREAYDGFTSGDLDPLLAALTDDIAWRDSTIGPLAGDYNGKNEVLGLFGRMMEVYAGTMRLEVVDILANDSRGVVLTREQGTASGETANWTGVHVWGFRDGRCAQLVTYADADYQQFWAARAPRASGADR